MTTNLLIRDLKNMLMRDEMDAEVAPTDPLIW